MALVQVKGTSFYRDTESMGLVNRDRNGLDDYNMKRKMLLTQKDEIKLEFILDKTSIEVFYNNGETVMTEIFFPNSPFQTLKLSTTNNSDVISVIINVLKSLQYHTNYQKPRKHHPTRG